MKTRKTFHKWLLCCGALSSALVLPVLTAQAQDDGDNKIEKGEQIVVTDPDAKTKDSPTTTSHMAPPPGSDERADMRMVQNPRFMVDTLSEEKTEIAALKAQAMKLRNLGGSKNVKMANLLDRMRREHEAAGPKMIALTKSVGGNPALAKIMKPPVIGSPGEMLHATHMDHDKAVKMSQLRWKMSNSPKVRTAMTKRATLARRHMRWMKPYHNAKNCPMCASMMHSTSMMKDGMKHDTHGMKTM